MRWRWLDLTISCVVCQGDRRSAGAHGLGLSTFNMDTKYGRLALEKLLLAAMRRIEPEVLFPPLPEGEDTKARQTGARKTRAMWFVRGFVRAIRSADSSEEKTKE